MPTKQQEAKEAKRLAPEEPAAQAAAEPAAAEPAAAQPLDPARGFPGDLTQDEIEERLLTEFKDQMVGVLGDRPVTISGAVALALLKRVAPPA